MVPYCAWLGYVGRQAVPLEEADQYIHIVFQSVRFAWAHHVIIVIEDSEAPPDGLSQPVMIHLMVLPFYGQPGSDDIIHYRIENRQGY